MTNKKLYRNGDDGILAGVCGGLADYFEIDVTLVRIIFIILAIGGGSGILLYLILWLVVPNKGDIITNDNREENIKEFTDDLGKKAKNMAKEFKKEIKVEKVKTEKRQGSFFGLILMFLGIILLIDKIIPMVIEWDYVWPIMIIIFGGYLFYGKSR